MSALKLLLDRLNTGNIPLSKEAWEKLQKEPPPNGSNTNSLNIFRTGGGKQVRHFICLSFIVMFNH